MSVNPVVAASAAGANVPVEQLIAAELAALTADAEALASQVTTGQVVTAQVLPSNGLTDLINILGNRVAAALPPTLQVGDLFTAQVTGFNGPQILLQILGTPEPGQLVEAPAPGTVPLPDEPLSALAAAATRPLLPEGVAPSLAPPPAVFVAASVRPAAPSAGGSAAPPVSTPSSQAIAAPPTVLADIEARLAAARAGSIGVNVPTAAPSPGAPANVPPPVTSTTPNMPNTPNTAPALPSASATPASGIAAPPAMAPGRFVLAPTITPSTRFAEAPAAGAAPASDTAAPAPTGLAAYRDPTALVRALNLPVTPTNIAAARLAIATPQRLPAALATLESALPQLDDPRVATLRTLTAFIGRMEPSSPQLASQISAFVDNVVTGNEPKLSALLAAQLVADEPAQAAAAVPGQAGETPAGTAPAAPLPTIAVVALAQIAERGAAMSVDLKTQLLALINAPPAGAENAEALLPAASSALTAITAVQVNAAQAMNISPQTMAFTLPMWLGSGYAQARIAIDRDAPEPNAHRSLDGDNFHIAFVLDTKHLGTVTVDLQTVGRAFSLAVKAESEGTAKRFGEAISRLTDRLQTLRYRVNSAEATVAPRGSPEALTGAAVPVAAAPEDDGDIPSEVNVRA
jgi:hypothetical protein